MHRLLAFTLVLAATCLASSASATDLMPPYIMDRLGLTQAWARPMQVPIGAQSIGDQQLFVHQQGPTPFLPANCQFPVGNIGNTGKAPL